MTSSPFRDPFIGSFGSLEMLVDRISEVLKCPVTIEDANHRLLAYSSHDERTDPARVATIIGRRVPEKVINSLWRDGAIPRLNQSDEPVRISEIIGVGLGTRVAIAIRSKHEILGYIWILEIDNQLSDEDMDLLKLAAQSARNQLLQLKIRKKKKEEGYQEFFWQLLNGDIHSSQEIEKNLDRLGIIPSYPYYVTVFQFESEITSQVEQHISYMITTTQKIKVTFHVIDRNDLILLCSPLPNDENGSGRSLFIDDFIKQMNQRFHIQRISGGCGNGYDDFHKVEASYQEALTVLQLKKKFPIEIGKSYEYQDLGIYRYLEVLKQKNAQDRYENVILKKLIKYDRTNHTHLFESLKVFLDQDSNVNLAAKELHVHVNTLNYRLKRISEITGIDLKDANQKTALYIDIKLHQMQN